MGSPHDECTAMLVRHQWVREHETPRVTTLAGKPDAAERLWREWLELTRRPRDRRSLFAQPARADAAWIDRTAAKASELAIASPRKPVAIAVDAALLASWLAARDDRLSAFIAEGVVHVHATRKRAAPARAKRPDLSRARSLAELTLYEALQGTRSTAGRFELNQSVSFVFGARGAEVDLLSRADAIAIEVDGYHHFGDPEHYRRDRRKDLLLQAHGYAVLRFLADDVLADPRDAVRMVVELLGRRLARERLDRGT